MLVKKLQGLPAEGKRAEAMEGIFAWMTASSPVPLKRSDGWAKDLVCVLPARRDLLQ
jgi:hypothetical protein